MTSKFKLYEPQPEIDADGKATTYFHAALTHVDDDGNQWEEVPVLPGSKAPKTSGSVKRGRDFDRTWIQQTVETYRIRLEHPNYTPHHAAGALWLRLDDAKLRRPASNKRPPVSSTLGELVTQVFNFADHPLKTKRGKGNSKPPIPVRGKAMWIQYGLETYKLLLAFPHLEQDKIVEKLKTLLQINDLIPPSPGQLQRLVEQVFSCAANPLAAKVGNRR